MQDLLDAGSPMRLKKCRRGYMLYSINDVTIGRSLDMYGEFSEGETALFEMLIRADDIVVEVGANIGAHTLALSQFVGPRGRVYAFEPQMFLFQTLCANIALNNCRNVVTMNAAIGAKAGQLELPAIDYDSPNLFGSHAIGGGGGGGTVQCFRLDDLLKLPRCRFMKIDVEGMEAEVIDGAADLIRTLQPILYVENDRREKSEPLIRQIMDLGYDLYWHLPFLYQSKNFFDCPDNIFGQVLSINMLCMPPGAQLKGMEDKKINSPADWWEDTKPS